jgi:hypothetical protein
MLGRTHEPGIPLRKPIFGPRLLKLFLQTSSESLALLAFNFVTLCNRPSALQHSATFQALFRICRTSAPGLSALRGRSQSQIETRDTQGITASGAGDRAIRLARIEVGVEVPDCRLPAAAQANSALFDRLRPASHSAHCSSDPGRGWHDPGDYYRHSRNGGAGARGGAGLRLQSAPSSSETAARSQ